MNDVLFKQAKTALCLLATMVILTGVIYPAFVTLFSQLLFYWKANGSLLELNGQRVGSILIGQAFTDPGYFSSRPSATTPFAYNAQNSSGSNLGPSNATLFSSIKERVFRIKSENIDSVGDVPVDLVTASASGLDPDITPLAAFYQIPRIAKIRGVPELALRILVTRSITHRTFGLLGEPRINVLELNIALDYLATIFANMQKNEKNHE